MKKILKNWGIALLSALFIACAAFMLMPAKTKVAEAALYTYGTATLSDLLGDNHSKSFESNSVVTISECTTSGQTLIIKYNGASDYSSDMSRLQWSYTVTGSVSMSANAASVRLTSNKPMENLRFGGSSNKIYLTLESSTASSYTYSGTVINKSSYFSLTFGQFNGQIQDVVLTALEFQIYVGSVPASCNVTLNKNNGTGGTDSVSASYGSAMPSATMPTRTGYTFNGYYDASSGGTQYYTSAGASAKNWDKGDETATLYAQWTANKYSITYKDGGGSNFSGTHASGYPTQHTYGTATNLKSATKTGYTFGGWFTNSNCTGTAVTALGATAYTANITLYAKWTANKYNITYKDGGNKTFSGSHESGYPTQHTYGTATTLKSATKTGYTFSGWFTNSNCTGTAVTSLGATTYTANITLYAKWTAKTYTVTLDQNGGSDGSNSVSATYGSAMPSATMPTRTGYTFSGYFDSNNTKYYNANGTSAKNWDKAGTATLTAQWQINQYPVSCPASTEHASFFLSSSDNATSGASSGNFDYNSIVYFYVVADEGYYAPDGSSWQKIATSGDKIVYRANSLTVSTDTNEFTTKNPQRGADIVASATGYNAPFDKGSHSITVNVTTPASDYVIKYKVGSSDYSATNPQYTNVCNVTVEYKVTADGYYPFIGSATVVITQQKNVSYTTAPVKNEGLIYNGAEQALLTAGASNYGTVQYKVGSEGEWTNTVPQIKNVGEYVVYYRVPEDANQAGISESSFTVSIAEVNKDELNDIIATVDAYYGTIKDDYSSIAAVLDGHRQQIYNDYYANPNVTETQVADAVNALNGYIDAAKIAVTEAKIDAIGTVIYTPDKKALIDDARNYFDNVLNDTQRELVDSDKVAALVAAEDLYNAVDVVVNQIKNIGQSADTQAFRDKVSDARTAFNNLTDGQESIFPAAILKTLTDYEAAINVMNLINAIGDVEYTADSAAKIDAANDAYTQLGDEDQKPLVANYDKLVQANTDYDKVDEAVGKITAIGDLEYTTDKKALIEDARETYDALSAYQKSIFPEDVLKTLEDDEKAYESMDKIRAIGTIENTATSKGKIVEARETYDALTVDQNGLVAQSFVKELEDAEAAFNAIEKVNEIGSVKYTDDSKALIEKARAVYDSLSEEQKRLIPLSVFDALEAAETTYKTTEKNAKTLSTVMNVILGVLLAAGIVVLILLIRKRNKDKKDGGTKLMSVSALQILLLANNHYFDARFIILYVLAVLTVAVWITNLILFLKKRKDGIKEVVEDDSPIEEDVEPILDEPSSETAESEDGEEAEIITEENGVKFRIRYLKSFMARLIQSDDETKAFYGELKNEMLSYGNTVSRVSWKFDTVYYGRKPVLKFGIRGKTLCVYYPLDVKELKATKYKVDLCESKRYVLVPCMYRIKNAHRCELAKDLIAIVAEKFGLVKGEQQNVEYVYPYEDTAALIEKGLIKEIKRAVVNNVVIENSPVHAISVSEADAEMSDEVAATYIEDDVNSKKHKGKKGIINIDTICEIFNDGDTVDIEALWDKKLVPTSVGYVKVLARGTLNKKLNIDLQDYSIQAVKMVVLEGGTVKKAK